MSITSYAQNFEDVMLWRALGHIERGFYIDIGAQDPVIDSVSLAFHEHGWQGIHVEPTPHYAELLRQQRPGDTVIQAAVGNGPTVLQFFEIPSTGISTADACIAAQHRERGFDVREITVPCITLSAIFDACAEPEIHWLKIDVEGVEEQVLSSWGSSAARPWIVVIESTLPLTQIETHESWQALLIAYGYTPVYFDGLNRYYVSDAHPEIKVAFASPPNVFDGFALNGTASAPFHQLIEARHQEKISETLVQREQEVAVQLIAIQEQAAQEKAELARSHNEQERALQIHYVEQEQVLNKKIQALQEQLNQLQQERVIRERLLHEQNIQSRLELENVLRQLVQREQQVAAHLLTIQQQAAQEKAELARSHSEQERALHSQYAEREKALTQQLQAGQQELHRLQQEREQREKDYAEKTSQARQDLENLLRNQTQREQEINEQLLAIQQQAQQEKAGHIRLLEACAALEARLQAEMQSGQQASMHLRQLLAEVQHSLDMTHTSLSWRMTAPLRKLAGLFNTHKSQTPAPVSLSEPLPPEPGPPAATGAPPIAVNQASFEPTMPPLAQATATNMTTIASTLPELLACHDQQFVRCAYETLLGREPDPEGLGYYLGRLRMGFSKIQILAQLRLSNEGKTYAAKLPGLDTAIRRHQREQYPLIGGLFRRFNGAEGNSPTERKLRGIENQLFLLSDESNRRFNQLETALAGLHHLVVQQTQSVVASLGGTPLDISSNSSITSIQSPEPDGFNQLSPRAREIYSQLKTAAATQTRRII